MKENERRYVERERESVFAICVQSVGLLWGCGL